MRISWFLAGNQRLPPHLAFHDLFKEEKKQRFQLPSKQAKNVYPVNEQRRRIHRSLKLRKGLTEVGQTPLFFRIISFRPLESPPQIRFPPFDNHAPLFLWLISASLTDVNNFQRYLKWRHSQKKEIIKYLLSVCLHCTPCASYSVGKPLTVPEHVNHKASSGIKSVSSERAPNG